MSEKQVERRLAAILAADVAGYSRLVGADEEGTLARLKALRHELIDPAIAQGRGRVVKTMGDGILIEFPSVVEAVRCAIEVQRGMVERNRGLAQEQRIEFRVGIHLGDVVADRGDLLGDGVNVAARLEGISETGGICLSEDAFRQVQDKIAAAFVDLGEQTLKNIARPMRVYRVDLGAGGTAEPAAPVLALPDKPSIAVLPFQNMSGDPEQEYFCDGVVEDIITALSRIRWLFVIARNSSFAYKGKSPDIRQVGRELGVRYVLEGSVRKAGGRVRMTGQLIDATTGAHIWADRLDGGLEEIFDLQDRIAVTVAGVIEPALRAAEMRRAQIKPTSSMDAYDFFLRALAEFHSLNRSGSEQTLTLCKKAIDVDPRYASAYGLAAWCHLWRVANGWAEHPEDERVQGLELARRAADFGSDDPEALWMAAHCLSFLAEESERAADLVERSLALNPNSANAWNLGGWIRWHLCEGEKAVDHFNRALRLSPLDPLAFTFLAGMGWAYFVQGRYEEAADWATRALHKQPKFMGALKVRMAACGLLGRIDEATEAKRMTLTLDPTATVTTWLRQPLKLAEVKSAYAEGLRKAGLPE